MVYIKNQKGVSLLELLVVIAIIGIMSLIMIPQYSKYKQSKSLALAKTQITNDIRTVQNYTFTTLKFGTGPGANFPKGGYGIHFDKDSSSYIIFADMGNNPNQTYDGGEFFEEAALPGDVEIKNLEKRQGSTGAFTPVNNIDFVAAPPYGAIFIDKIDPTTPGGPEELKITFANNGSVNCTATPENCDSVTLSSSGFIQ
jgi:prepilin-type N-terminal cleavage/methylation domain-containing protein